MHIREVPADLEGFLLLQRKVPADYKGFLLTIWVPAILERFLRSLKGSCSMLIFPKPSRFLLFSDGSCKILPPWRIFWFLLSSCCFDPQSNAKTSATKFLLKSSCWFTMTFILEGPKKQSHWSKNTKRWKRRKKGEENIEIYIWNAFLMFLKYLPCYIRSISPSKAVIAENLEKKS